MRSLVVLSVIALSFLVSGCLDYMFPDVAVKGTLEAISKNDLSGLHDSLTGAALEEYGNAGGLATLEQMFGKYTDTEVQQPHLIDRKFEDGEEVLRIYQLEVLGKNQSGNSVSIAEFTVDCEVHWVPVHNHPGLDDRMTCLVSDIRPM